jgi:hypothetical protein
MEAAQRLLAAEEEAWLDAVDIDQESEVETNQLSQLSLANPDTQLRLL